MRIVHLSFAQVVPPVHDPHQWLDTVSFLTGVMEAMARQAEVVGVFHLPCKQVVVRSNVTYHFTGFTGLKLKWPSALNRFVAGLKPDVVIVHGLVFPLQLLLLRNAVGTGVTIICQYHADRPFSDARRLLQKLAGRTVDAYLFPSSMQADEWITSGQISAKQKVHEVMGMSSPFSIQPRPQVRRITNATGQPVYVWVGALDTNKDPVTLVRAFAKLAANVPRATLYIIYNSSALENEVRALVSAMTVGRVHLLGDVSRKEMSTWLNSADFIISTSHFEASGIAVCEGMSCGCIPVLTDIPSFRMMTSNGTVGLLFKAGDADSLYDALMKTTTMDIAAASAAVVRQFETQLSFEANASRIFEVISAVRR